MAEAQRIVGNRKREDETGANRLHVEGGAPGHSEARLDLGGSRREGVVGGCRSEDEEIEIAAAHAGVGQRLLCRANGEIGGQLSRGGDPALADPGALADPFVRGVEPARQFGVGDDALGQIDTAPGDLGSQLHRGGFTVPAPERTAHR